MRSLGKADAFVPSYFGVFGAGQTVADAYQKPIAEAVLRQADCRQMVADIDKNLRAAAGG